MKPSSAHLTEPPADDRTLMPDADATIRMPAPGGQATVVLPRPAGARTPGIDQLQRMVAGLNPVLEAASVLLALVPKLRSTTAHAEPARLRDELLTHSAEFESVAASHGVPRPKIGAARYVLCTFLDEAIASTPWGAGGVWADRSLLQEFHEERSGAHKAFDLIERLMHDPANNSDLIELFYVCLALGFEGRWHGIPEGRAQLDALAERLLALRRPAGDGDVRTLSPRWQGVAHAGRRALRGLPLPVVLVLSGAVVVGWLLVLHARLNDAAAPVFRRVAAVPQALAIERHAAARPRIAPALHDDVSRGVLTVRDEATRSLLTLPADAWFERGGARVRDAQRPVLARVAQALKAHPGQVTVIGHNDDASTGSLQFPSGWHLSRARAQAVAAVLAQHGVVAQAEGRADAEPVAPSTSDEGRARNRRVEIELRLPRPQGA